MILANKHFPSISSIYYFSYAGHSEHVGGWNPVHRRKRQFLSMHQNPGGVPAKFVVWPKIYHKMKSNLDIVKRIFILILKG
jgi:hypothetical protein